MKTRKTAFLALIALAISGGLIFFGCDLLFPPDEPTPTDITFTVTANTPADKNTESLDIRFSEAVTGLTANDISLSASNVTKGSLSGSGANYNLTITVSGFADSYPCTVTVHKTGVSSSAQSVSGGVVNNEGKINFKLATVSSVNNGAAKVLITLTKDVSLNADQITITQGQAIRGDLTSVNSSKKSYELALTGAKAETIKIKIENSQVTNEEREVTLESASTPTPGTGIPVNRIVIRPKDNRYRTDYAPGDVEFGYDREYEAFVTPTNATNKNVVWDVIDPSVATVTTVNNYAKVSARSRIGYTHITAKSTDGSGVGAVFVINIRDRVLPDNLIIATEGNDTNEGQIKKTDLNNSSAPNYSIQLVAGDKELILTTELQDNTSKRTNDQSVIPTVPSYTETYFTYAQGGFEDGDGDVPRGQFKLTPTKVPTGTADPNKPIEITLTSAYEPETNAKLTITVVGKQISATDIIFSYLDSNGKNPSSLPINYSSTVSAIYVVVDTTYPYDSVSLSVAAGQNGKKVTIGQPLKKTPKEAWFLVTKTASGTDKFNEDEMLTLEAKAKGFNANAVEVTSSSKVTLSYPAPAP